jgi:hypothetical protein
MPSPEPGVGHAATGISRCARRCGGVAGSRRGGRPAQKSRESAPSDRSDPIDYSGVRGEGSIPVPLPPPACPKFSILRLNLLVIKPSRATNSHLNSGLLIGRAAHSSPNGPFFSGALDSTDSVRFSKFECFERLMKSGGMEFCCSSRTGKSVRFRNRHIEVRILPPQPPSPASGDSLQPAAHRPENPGSSRIRLSLQLPISQSRERNCRKSPALSANIPVLRRLRNSTRF